MNPVYVGPSGLPAAIPIFPLRKQHFYNYQRSSQVYIKKL